jgi:hypothetical protein
VQVIVGPVVSPVCSTRRNRAIADEVDEPDANDAVSVVHPGVDVLSVPVAARSSPKT